MELSETRVVSLKGRIREYGPSLEHAPHIVYIGRVAKRGKNHGGWNLDRSDWANRFLAQRGGPQRKARPLNNFALAHNGLVRGLAALAIMTPDGVTFAGLHWCVQRHEDCPTLPRPVAKPVTAEEIAEVVALDAEYEAALARNGYARRPNRRGAAKAGGS